MGIWLLSVQILFLSPIWDLSVLVDLMHFCSLTGALCRLNADENFCVNILLKQFPPNNPLRSGSGLRKHCISLDMLFCQRIWILWFHSSVCYMLLHQGVIISKFSPRAQKSKCECQKFTLRRYLHQNNKPGLSGSDQNLCEACPEYLAGLYRPRFWEPDLNAHGSKSLGLR